MGVPKCSSTAEHPSRISFQPPWSEVTQTGAVPISTVLLKSCIKEQRSWKSGKARREECPAGLLALQRGTVVVLTEDEGRQDLSHHSHEPWTGRYQSTWDKLGKWPQLQQEAWMGEGGERAKARGCFQGWRSTISWGARGVPALQWDGSAPSLFSLGFTSTKRTFQTPPWCQLRGFRTKVMIWGCTTKMFRSEKRWKMKQVSPCLALDFLREADVWFQDFGRHSCTRDMKSTEGKEQKDRHVHSNPSIFAWWGCSTYKNCNKTPVN